jgi:hypothetical protein
MPTIENVDKILIKRFLDIKEQVQIIQNQIIETCDVIFENLLNLQKRKCIIYAKFINAFLSRDLELLKTLNKKYSDISSDYITECSELHNLPGLLKTKSLDDGSIRSGDHSFLNTCNMEKKIYEDQQTLIQLLDMNLRLF